MPTVTFCIPRSALWFEIYIAKPSWTYIVDNILKYKIGDTTLNILATKHRRGPFHLCSIRSWKSRRLQ